MLEELEKQRKAKGKEAMDIYDKESYERECYCRSPSWYAMEDYESLNFDLPDEDVLLVEEEKLDSWIMYFDGDVDVCFNGVGAVIISPD